MLLQATDVTEVRSSQLSELTDAAEAEALRLPLSVAGSDGGALDRGDGADSHGQCRAPMLRAASAAAAAKLPLRQTWAWSCGFLIQVSEVTEVRSTEVTEETDLEAEAAEAVDASTAVVS